jgi:tetratricopeptide (TPR) repeat protein
LLASALGYAYVLSEQVAKGISLLQQAIQQAEARQVLFRYALWLVWLGEAYLLASQVEDALDLAEQAHERACTYKELGHQAYALRLLGEIAVHGDLIAVEKAETAYQQALALANSQGMCPLQAHCHLGLGTLYHKEGLLTQARNELSAAVELFSSMDMTFWQQRANALLVEMD